MSNEYINYEQVRRGATELKECADKIQEVFDSVAGSVRIMTNEDNFTGRASNALQAEFEPFRAKFADYVSAVRRFATLFEAAASTMEATEQKIANQASEL